MQDSRALRPILGRILREAARDWPPLLPIKPSTILDVGAHRGEVAEQLAELYHPSFIGLVEPLPQMLDLLQAKSLAPNQKLFPCALGGSEGTAVLNVLASLPSSSLLEPSKECELLFDRPMNKTRMVEVPMRTLDEIFSECGLLELDLLKIDVQGYELQVFMGGRETLKKTRLIISEVSFFEHYEGQPLFKKIYDFLTQIGFEMRGTFGYSYDSRGIPLQCDAVFINRLLISD